jgi:uridine kinase
VPGLPDLTRRDLLVRVAALIGALEAPVRVGIDGPDAAGKTTLADELAVVLAAAGRPVKRLSADDFLRVPEHRHRRGRESPEGYYEDSFDHQRLRHAVLGLGSPLLVDGIFLQRPELDDLWTLRIFVSIGENEVLRRGIERDGAEMERLYRVRYLPGQRLYAERVAPRDRADVVIENDDPDSPGLIVRRGEPGPAA